VAIKIALPKGRLLRKTAVMLQKADWGLGEYHSKMGFYRPRSQKFPELLIRVFHEKDIPIQIAMGNYDLGICGLDWIDELLVKYPTSDLVKVKDLGYGAGSLYMAASVSPDKYENNSSLVRIATEYPNLAEAYALRKRLARFAVFPVWGAAEAYPPENAEMALLSITGGNELYDSKLAGAGKLLDFSAFLVANRHSWEASHLDEVVASICNAAPEAEKRPGINLSTPTSRKIAGPSADTVRLALPDGHQQQHVVNLLNKAGIGTTEYPSETGNHRPGIDLEGVVVKVIRPQDMPWQVANGNFDLAISGRDWLTEHLDQFPSSPVKEIADLKSGKVRLVAVISRELAVENTAELREHAATRETPVRIASEYVNIADKYARDNHLGNYRVIPTWGATEAFLPEDADMLIENTETGRTIARHNLKIIDTIFESTGCLIGRIGQVCSPVKTLRIKATIERLRTGVEAG
jgi:ATP phosphoribosyltransferase